MTHHRWAVVCIKTDDSNCAEVGMPYGRMSYDRMYGTHMILYLIYDLDYKLWYSKWDLRGVRVHGSNATTTTAGHMCAPYRNQELMPWNSEGNRYQLLARCGEEIREHNSKFLGSEDDADELISKCDSTPTNSLLSETQNHVTPTVNNFVTDKFSFVAEKLMHTTSLPRSATV